MKITRLLLALLALATGAFAQDNNTAKLALAREAIAAMQADKMLTNMSAQMKQMAAKMTAEAAPADASPAARKIAEEYQGKLMDLSMDSIRGMVTQLDQIYADVYSEAELKTMLAFFKSPEGQSMMAKQPQIMQRVMPLAQSMQRDLMPKIMQLGTEMREKIAAAKAAEAPPAAK